MKKIEHIGIAVKNLKTSNELFASILVVSHYKIEKIDSQQVETSFFKKGPNKIELLQGICTSSII